MTKSNLVNKKIFVVDDSDIILTQASTILKKRFYVQTFNAASKMLKIAKTMPVFPDMILLDIEMPEMHGSEVLDQLKEIPVWKDIPLLLMTSWDSDMVLGHFFELGALDVIHKPIVQSVMLNRVEKYLMLSEFVHGENENPIKIYFDERVRLTRNNVDDDQVRTSSVR